MQVYANNGGGSNVIAYEIGSDWIKVKFGDGSIYTYTHGIPGAANVQHMKQLARAGSGLNSFITRVVKKDYASKQR